MNYRDTLNYIHSLGNFSLPATLDRIKAVSEALGNPQKELKAIHIAGTNGKGSVSVMTASILQEAGYTVGLYTSPFIVDFRERIQINGEYISEEDLCLYAERVKSAGVALTEFEFITAVGFLYFAEKKVDILVCETGLGGRLDATNILENKAVAVITQIGLDHMAILGDTIEKITDEKCGILRDCPTVTAPYMDKRAFDRIKAKAKQLTVPDKSRLSVEEKGLVNTYIYKGQKYELSLSGEYQIENALTATEAVKNCGLKIEDIHIYKGLKNAFIPARTEIISKSPLVVLDGAHNPNGADAIVKELSRFGGNVTAVVGMMKDKDSAGFLSKTLKYCKNVVFVTVEDMPRSAKAEDLFNLSQNICNCHIAKSYSEAVKKATFLASGNPIFVFGSLYLAAGIRPCLKEFFKNCI